MLDVDVTVSDSRFKEREANTLKQNIIFFCTTPKGSLPQMRGYGLDFTILDEPFSTLRMKATVDIISGVRNYYGVQINDIKVTADENGKTKIKIII